MRKYRICSLNLLKYGLLINLILFTMMFLDFNKNNNDSQKVVLLADKIEISISSDKDKLSDGSYVVGSEITFEINDDDYMNVSITLSGSERAFPYDLEQGTAKWFLIWNTDEPKSGDKPVTPDTYEIKLEIDGSKKDCDPEEIVISSSEASTIPIWVIIVIIIAIAGGISISSFFVIKRNRAKKAEALQFDKVDKKKSKKKGEIYSGSSAIGKKSGELAEDKLKEAKSVEESPSSLIPVEKPSPKESTLTQKQPKQIMPAEEFQFEVKTAKSTALIKDMEQKMDIESKVEFLSSKIESMLQNIEFFKVILSQHNQEQLICPKCKKKTSEFWALCPFCLIEERSADLGLKQSLLSIGENIRFCPNCKQVIQPNWMCCPYCFVKK